MPLQKNPEGILQKHSHTREENNEVSHVQIRFSLTTEKLYERQMIFVVFKFV